MKPIGPHTRQTYTLKQPTDPRQLEVYQEVLSSTQEIRDHRQAALREDQGTQDLSPTPGLVMLRHVKWDGQSFRPDGSADVLASPDGYAYRRAGADMETCRKSSDGTETYTWMAARGAPWAQQIVATYNGNGTITADVYPISQEA